MLEKCWKIRALKSRPGWLERALPRQHRCVFGPQKVGPTWKFWCLEAIGRCLRVVDFPWNFHWSHAWQYHASIHDMNIESEWHLNHESVGQVCRFQVWIRAKNPHDAGEYDGFDLISSVIVILSVYLDKPGTFFKSPLSSWGDLFFFLVSLSKTKCSCLSIDVFPFVTKNIIS